MSVSIVNGYSCSNCADVSKAKKGQDPLETPAELATKQVEEASEKARASVEGSSQLDILA